MNMEIVPRDFDKATMIRVPLPCRQCYPHPHCSQSSGTRIGRNTLLRWVIGIWLAVTAGVVIGAEKPIEMSPLDSANVKRASPFLFFSADEVALARRQSETPELKSVFEKIQADARKAMEVKLEPFPSDWWPKIKDKPWSDTYPEINQHTNFEPAHYAVPLDTLARYYLITGDVQTLECVRRTLLHLCTFSFEPEHYDVGLNYSVWLLRALMAYDAIFDKLDAGQRKQIDDFFTRGGRAILKNDLYWIANNVGGGINNHLAWHKMMIGLLGMFYNQPALVDFALHGPRGMVELLEAGLVDDGLWCESSLTYHFTAIYPMVIYADALRRCGCREDLATMTLADGRTLRQSLDAMIDVQFPDGTVPPIGDAYGRRPHLAGIGPYELAWRLWQDPRYAWLLAHNTQRTSAALFVPPLPGEIQAPPIASRLFPEHGYAFLRSRSGSEYWNTDAYCAMFTFDRVGVHSNQDKLGLMLFGFGRMLLPDVEGRATVPHAFSSRIQRELNRGALSQNTVMIDGKDQKSPPRVLDLIEYRDLPAEKRVTAADRSGLLYDGARQQRTLCLTDSYLLDVFQVVCDKPRQIDWVMHAMDEKAERLYGPESKPIEPPSREADWAWLRNYRAAASDADWRIGWQSDGGSKKASDRVELRLDVLGSSGTQIIECDYPASDQPDSGAIPMLMVRRKAAQTTFAVVYTAGREPPAEVKLRALPDREGKLVFAVEQGGRQYVHTVPKLTP